MKLIHATLLTAAAFAASAQTPEITQVSMTQGRKRIVTIDYTLQNAPAIITVDIQTNGVSIGDANISGGGYLAGDVNFLAPTNGSYRIRWDVANAWPDHDIPSGVRAVVSAWSPDTPPDIIVADLTSTSNVEYYTSIEALPGGLLANQAYRTTKIVMKKIHANGIPWTMGSVSETGRQSNEYSHGVTLTNDYFMGVFPVTQGQFECVFGSSRNPSTFKFNGDKAMRPVEMVRYVQLRQNTPGNSSANATYAYPNAPLEGSIIGEMRRLTGIKFEVPSEAQWEFACRALNGEGKWGNGTSCNGSDTDDANLPGRYLYNQATPGSTTADATVGKGNGTAEVGTYGKNGFGLYDMHGNVFEWTLDFYIKDRRTLPDGDAHGAPNAAGQQDLNGESGSTRVAKGGSWKTGAQNCRSAYRSTPSQTGNANDRGVRLVIVLD